MNNQPQREPSTVVFVGNITFDSRKEDLQKLLEEIGPVVKLRMLRDDSSGKLRGYAFAEYGDQRLASHAVSRLNGVEFYGRQLRVDYADQKSTDPTHNHPPPQQQQQFPSGVPPPMQQANVHYPGKSITDPIMAALSKIPSKELTEVLNELSEIARTNPEKITTHLQQDPRLALLVMHGLYLAGARKDPFVTIDPSGMNPMGPTGMGPGPMAPMPPLPPMPPGMGPPGMGPPGMGHAPINTIGRPGMGPNIMGPGMVTGGMGPIGRGGMPNQPPIHSHGSMNPMAPMNPMTPLNSQMGMQDTKGKSWRDDPKYSSFANITDEQLKKLLDITPQQLAQLGESQRKLVQLIQQNGSELRRFLR